MSAPLRGHQRIDQRSLALHRAIAAKLRRDPALLTIALDRWSQTAGRSQPYWDEWRSILARPLPEVLELLEEEREHMTAMRQATPTLTINDAAFTFTHRSIGGGAWLGGVGGPNEIEKVTVNYTWTLFCPMLWPFFPNGQINLTVDSVMKNEDRWQ